MTQEYTTIHEGRCAQRDFAQIVAYLWKLKDDELLSCDEGEKFYHFQPIRKASEEGWRHGYYLRQHRNYTVESCRAFIHKIQEPNQQEART